MFAALVFLLLGASPALAHQADAVGPAGLWAAWRPDPLLAMVLVAVAAFYLRGIARLWGRAGRGRGVGPLAATAFGAGVLMLAAALISPLDPATGTLLSAHMVQHVVLIAVAPPLLLLGRPEAVFLFGLPHAVRGAASRTSWLRLAASGLRRLARPLPAAVLHAVGVWIWHAPGPFQAALENRALHELEHASYFATALLFWHSVLAAGRNPARLIAGLVATTATLIQGGFLGGLIALSGRPLYPAYGGAGLWGLSAMQDQQLAGLIMWVPAGAMYLLAGLWLASRIIGSDEPASGAAR